MHITNRWTQITRPTVPISRRDGGFAFDSINGKFVLFCGYDVTSSTEFAPVHEFDEKDIYTVRLIGA